MKCPYCEKEIDDKEKVCPYCEGSLMGDTTPKREPVPQEKKQCPTCGTELDKQDTFCSRCGRAMNGIWQGYAPTAQGENEPQSNGMAVAGFVCSFFSPILGWIFGGIGLSNSRKRKGKGKGLSIAAIVLASVSFAFNLMILFSM